MPVKVAICEDNDHFRESLHQYLAGTPGLEVVQSLGGADRILEELQTEVPHVCLMDIDMPGRNGIEATAVLKSRFPEVSVLMLTVFEDDEKIFAAILAGASGYLLKKTPPQKIVEAILEVREGGASMSAPVVKKVLQFFQRTQKKEPANSYDLSGRERDILQCIVAGDSYKMIADHCKISIGTVRSHINNIYKKLHINSKSEAVAKALNEGLVH